jgi:Uma2 family endonuclease
VTTTVAATPIVGHAELPSFHRAEQIMSMPATEHHRWTEAEVRRLIDEAPSATPRLELVDGELLVTPSPSRGHQRVVLQLVRILDPFILTNSLGELCLSPSDVRLAPELVVQPDLFVIPAVDGRLPGINDQITRLLLAVEVISSGSARFDRVAKRRAYQAAQVPEYWIVDPDARTIERWRPGDTRPEVIDDILHWQPDANHADLTLYVAALFAGALDPRE